MSEFLIACFKTWPFRKNYNSPPISAKATIDMKIDFPIKSPYMAGKCDIIRNHGKWNYGKCKENNKFGG